MNKTIKKMTTWLLVFCLIISFVPVFGSAAAAEGESVRAVAQIGGKSVPDEDYTELPPANSSEAVSGGLFGVLLQLFRAMGEGLRSVSVNELLNLPANVMDDVVTYIFAAFKLLGIDVGPVFEMITSVLRMK